MRMVLMLDHGMLKVFAQDIHGEQRRVKCCLMTLSDLCNPPKRLKEITCVTESFPIFNCQEIIFKGIIVLFLIPLNMVLLLKCYIQEMVPRIPTCVVVEW